MKKAFLLFGPSASGKSRVAEQLAIDHNFLHYEADRPDGINGIDFHQIRNEWNLFHDSGMPKPLSEILIQRANEAGKKGTVLSLPSMIFPPARIISALHEGLDSIILYGTIEECLLSFRDREKTSGRNLTDEHWLEHNSWSYARMGLPELSLFRVPAFINGNKRNLSEVAVEIVRRISR